MPFSLKLRVAAGVDPSGVPPPLFPPRVFHAYLSKEARIKFKTHPKEQNEGIPRRE